MTQILLIGLGALVALWALVDRSLRRGEALIAVRPAREPGPVSRLFALRACAGVRAPRLATIGSAEGMQVGDLRDSGAETCQVCGDRIVEQRVRCADCGAPHHPECWEYAGACSIYGCQSRRMRA